MQKPAALKAVGLLLTAMAILPLIDVLAKFLGRQQLPVIEMVWARFFFGAVLSGIWAVAAEGRAAVMPVNPLLNACRALALIAGTFFFFAGLKYLPVADTLAVYFVQPVLISALSPFVLDEKVGLLRWLLVLAGFCGVLVIIRPGLQPFNPGHMLALAAGASSAVYILITRKLTGRASPIITTFQTSALGAAALTALAPAYWAAPSANQWLLLALLGAIAIAGHYLITKAYDFGEASFLAPLNYTEMITSVIFGYAFFGDFPDAFTFLGVAILIGCALAVSQSATRQSAKPQTAGA